MARATVDMLDSLGEAYSLLDARPWLAHGLMAAAVMAATWPIGHPVSAALVVCAGFFARAQREQEYDEGVKSWASFLFWRWRAKLIGCFVAPAVVSALAVGVIIALN